MVSRKRLFSPIDYSEVNGIFGRRFRWQKHEAVYHEEVTMYRWNYYSIGYTLSLVKADILFKKHYQGYDYYGDRPVFTSMTEFTQANQILAGNTGSGAPMLNKWYVHRGNYHSFYLKIYHGVLSEEGTGVYAWTADEYEVVKTHGTYKGQRESTNRNAYPDNGISHTSPSTWYIYSGYNTTPPYYSKGDYLEMVEDIKEIYPEDSIYTDGYWYVKVE